MRGVATLGQRASAGGILRVSGGFGPELIANNSFENGNPPTSWFAVSSGVNTTVADPAPGSSGSKSVNMAVGVGQTVGGVLIPITLVVGVNYRLSLWFKNYDATYLSIIVFDSAWGQMQAWGGLVVTSWSYFTRDFVCTTAAGYFQCQVNGTANQHAQLDDVSIKAVL